jgi:putative FmdB family regulatory protein
MPLFEFRCRSCEREFELLVRNGETPLCPECNAHQLDKLMSAAAGHVAGVSSLPLAGPACPPPEFGPCGTGCCRLPQ